MNGSTGHPSELTLRRLLAGETVDAAAKAHADGCDACRARLDGFQAEQARFEAEIPFERFAAGVERAARTPRQTKARPLSSPNVRFALALAASLVAMVAAQRLVPADAPTSRLKGGADVEVIVAGANGGPQRVASVDPATPEALGPGERVRVGLKAGAWTYGVVVSVDESGAVSAVYDANGQSLALAKSDATQFLPDSLEFTGKGLERVIVVLSDRPLTLDEVTAAARARYEAAHGDLTHLAPLDVQGEQFHRTFLKP